MKDLFVLETSVCRAVVNPRLAFFMSHVEDRCLLAVLADVSGEGCRLLGSCWVDVGGQRHRPLNGLV